MAAEPAALSLNCLDRFISMYEPPVSLAILVSLDVDLLKLGSQCTNLLMKLTCKSLTKDDHW